MDKYIIKEGKELRLGYTTGTCAAAAAKAALSMLLTGENISAVHITTPSGASLYLDVTNTHKTNQTVSCAVVKDAGDDPDITHGIKIFATVCLTEGGIDIDGGEGVGRVTMPGLSVEIGKAAINPAPYKMIEAEITELCRQYCYAKGIKVIISVPQGRELAKKTFNPRLGIVGGISILGTTGLVEPMSEKALIDTIRLEMEVKHRQNNKTLLLTPGNYGVEFIKAKWNLDLAKGVKCSNYIGEALDYAVYLGFKSILLVGHAGKLLKLAAGVMNTHSKIADARMEILAAHAAMAGASAETVKTIMSSPTTEFAFNLLDSCGLTNQVAKTVAEKIAQTFKFRVGEEMETAFAVFRSNHQLFCMSDEARIRTMIHNLR